MRKLNIEKIKQNPIATISTKEALKDVTPYFTEDEMNKILQDVTVESLENDILNICYRDAFVCGNENELIRKYTSYEIFNVISKLEQEGIIHRRNCNGLAYEIIDKN